MSVTPSPAVFTPGLQQATFSQPASINNTINTILASLTGASGPLVPEASTLASTSTAARSAHPVVLPHHAHGQHEVWATLVARFGDAKLRRHTPEWVEHLHTWLPFYQFQPVFKITDIWKEYDEGLNGYISVRDLNTVWGAKWKRNKGTQKTEAGRRSKVVDLMERLTKKHRWDTARALRFLCKEYEGRMGCRAFCDYLTVKGGVGLAEVLTAAESFS
jgi:Transcriptional activator of glycolytic enzymes